MDTRLQNVVPPEGTCAGKATLVDASGDPIGYHLREALRLLEERHPMHVGSPAYHVRRLAKGAIEQLSLAQHEDRERRGE